MASDARNTITGRERGPSRIPESGAKKAVDRAVVLTVMVTGIPTSEAVGGLKLHAAPVGSPLQLKVAVPAVDWITAKKLNDAG